MSLDDNSLISNCMKIMLHGQKIKLEAANNVSKTAYILFSGEEPYKISLFQENEVNINGCGFLIPKDYLIEGLEFYISSVKNIISESNMKIKIQLYLAKGGTEYYPLKESKLEINLGNKFLRTDFLEEKIKVDNLILNRGSKIITVVSFSSQESKEEEFFIGGTLNLKTINDAV